ncbi:hypothetical protein UC8_13630 [Roseimaritima ulvae]|uniref:Uncharacterized protein n=2 Tax=Roseimaritima ulvae TaxID=980254 RepID=A0A5B9QQS7_9BACT|nr:hypothetical protein UC8_13630 [Roseimaritima ulvae]
MPSFDPAFLERNKAAIKQASPLLDQISQAWDEIEEFFKSQGILRGTWLCFDSIFSGAHAQPPIGEELIGIQKIKGAWRICIGELIYADPEDDPNWKPIGEAPTHLRISLLDHVHPLFEELVRSNEEYVKDIEIAAKKSQAVLTDLNLAGL